MQQRHTVYFDHVVSRFINNWSKPFKLSV